MEDFISAEELESLSKEELSELEELAKRCPRCNGASANKSNPAGRCRKCLGKLKTAKHTPGHYLRAHMKADDALRRQDGKNGTASHKSKGRGTRESIVRQTQSAEKKTGQKLSPDRIKNERGYASKNTRMVPEHLNRGRHTVDSKKLRAWKKRLKKCDLYYDEFYTMLLAKAESIGNEELLTLLHDMHYNDVANFINNEDTEELEKAVPGPEEHAYNIKEGYTDKDAKKAQLHVVKLAASLPHKPHKTMVNEETGKPELHIMMHRGVHDLDPNATDDNKFRVTDSHIHGETNSVHALKPHSANDYSYGNMDQHLPENLKFKNSPKESDFKNNEEFLTAHRAFHEKRNKTKEQAADQRQKEGKDGVLSFWVPVSKVHAAGAYMSSRFKNPKMPLPEGHAEENTDVPPSSERPQGGTIPGRHLLSHNPHAEDQGHVAIKPGKFRRVTEQEMQVHDAKGKDHPEHMSLMDGSIRHLFPKTTK